MTEVAPGPRDSTPPAEHGEVSHFDMLYGLEVTEIDTNTISAVTKVRRAVMQPWGIVHGGVYASIAEALASIATNTNVGPERVAVGQSNHTSFARPISSGEIRATGRLRHAGRTSWVGEVEMRDVQQRTCASRPSRAPSEPRRSLRDSVIQASG